ncbi:hypothetical protein GUITHDRAFT_153162 [Guillardia theta CCMP2712]|uniref:Uncharacterized protein n=2 Tax=Guillardia theta TaxID=55529 RepID=L1J6M4_GUITC|nr:hypothetical protein GUITHDRAFT_153162 [Guillardia theta CCMP2712]EKX43749.1 hypothetical protein GUITHDRAFT_153162 [Guillardia theta CCMP2712]|eukprot:XP_005830729.1 hypothetical protein GUITHDRAFT_153162 [Guillardia theta CCMP2712]
MLFTSNALEQLVGQFEEFCSRVMNRKIRIHIPKSQYDEIERKRLNSKRIEPLYRSLIKYAALRASEKLPLFEIGSKSAAFHNKREIEANGCDDIIVEVNALQANDDMVILVALEHEPVFERCSHLGSIPVFHLETQGTSKKREHPSSQITSIQHLLDGLESKPLGDTVSYIQQVWNTMKAIK